MSAALFLCLLIALLGLLAARSHRPAPRQPYDVFHGIDVCRCRSLVGDNDLCPVHGEKR